MISCSHCGTPAQEDLAYCQNCGMPLSNTNKVVGTAQPEKPELPAWLESLRTGEHPAVTPGGSSSERGVQSAFHTPEPIDEGALPGWMRSENADSPEDAASDSYPARRSASMPAPQTDGDYIPPQGIAASSLIDQQALPSWMQENNPSRQSAPNSLSASSLVQPDALPDWMRNLQTSPGLTPPPVPPGADPITPVQPIPVRNLIDQQALPSWMTGQTNLPMQPVQPPQAPQAPQPYQQPNAQSGLAASSLLDMNALPSWLRENESSQGQPPVNSGSLPFAQPGQAQPPNTSGPLAAASLIDMNALPEWLRAPENPGRGPANAGNFGNQGANSGAHFNAFGSQGHRPENMRVPSRPRGEMAAQEQSEVAANVFSSMLGVASKVPSFSSPPSGQPFGDPQASSVGQAQPSITQMPQTQGYMGYQGAYGGYPTGNQPAWPQQQQPATGSNIMPSMSDQERSGLPPASKPKRGFLETIRSWFSR